MTPLTCYLCSEDCAVTQHVFSVGGGLFSRVFLGTAPGWFAGRGSRPSIEDVRDHLGEITDPSGATIGASLADEGMRLLALIDSASDG